MHLLDHPNSSEMTDDLQLERKDTFSVDYLMCPELKSWKALQIP